MNKAEQLHTYPDLVLRSVHRSFDYPCVIRLKRYVRLPYRKVALSRNNIFRRDGHQCVYCGTRHDLTIDHVVPRSQGGRDSWENLATACRTCNTEKGNRTPEEAGMPMRHRPFRPSFIMFLGDYSGGRIHEYWQRYLTS
jgi:5-methylcytosine-specific restriction endonuclease McrA